MADAQFGKQTSSTVRFGQQTGSTGTITGHKVLRQTYTLLAMTLIWSAFAAVASMMLNPPHMVALFCMLGGFGMLFFLNRVANSAKALYWVFAFTGLMGFALGPMLNSYVMSSASGSFHIFQALSTTGAIFLSLSGYTLISKKDFSFMGGFLMVGLWVVIGAIVFNLIASLMGYPISGLHMAISSMVVFLMSGLILFDTSRILHGGETNYVRATVSLYLSIYNLFIHLLAIFGFAND